MPGMFGQFPKEFPDGQVKYFYLDWERRWRSSLPASRSRCGLSPARSASRARSPGATTPFRPGLCRQPRHPRPGRRHHLARAGVREGRAAVDRGLACRAGQRRSQSHRARDRVSGNQCDHHGRQDTQARMAAHRDASDWITMGFDEDLGKALDAARSETAKLFAEQRRFPPSRPLAWCRRLRIAA